MSTATKPTPQVGTVDNIRDDFFSVCERRRYTFYDCEVLGRVRIRSLTEFERMQVELGKYNNDGTANADGFARMPAKIVAATVVDSEGRTVFSEGDIEKLATMDTKYMSPLHQAIDKHVTGVESTTEDPLEPAKND